MATVTGLTAARMKEIEDAIIVDSMIVDGHLILVQHDGTEIDTGPVVGPTGPKGDKGDPGVAGISVIPGEIKLWPGTALPDSTLYGKTVWADGSVYPVATYPKAAAHIAAQWKTFDGFPDPGAGNFRVPDLRGLSPMGLDAMPGGSRANRMTRAVAITLAAKTGKETHQIAVAEMPSHAHGGATGSQNANHTHSGSTDTQGNHTHAGAPPGGNRWVTDLNGDDTGFRWGSAGPIARGRFDSPSPAVTGAHSHGVSTGTESAAHQHAIGAEGGSGAHENVQPTVFVPYIVCLDS